MGADDAAAGDGAGGGSGLLMDRAELWVPARGPGGLRLHAWVYVPAVPPAGGAPVMAMAHGFGGQKDFRLEPFARRFAAEGVVVVIFDYRHWGLSDGTPRQILNISKQHQDYFAVLDFCRDGLDVFLEAAGHGSGLIDPTRLALFGTSFSGGHVIAVAGQYEHKESIKAIISQVPYSGATDMARQMGPAWLASVVLHATNDTVRRVMGLSRHYIPIAINRDGSQPSSPAMLATPDCVKYWELSEGEPNGGWENRINASIAIDMSLYKPQKYAPRVTAPVFGLYSETDTLCPIKSVRGMFARLKGPVELMKLDGGHFAGYVDEFDSVSSAEAAFLKKHLL